MIDKKRFFENLYADGVGLHIRLDMHQVQGYEHIIYKWEASGYTDLRWLAYMLATAYHETARTIQPIEEYGRGIGRPYGKADAVTGKAYYGRGLVQLTWKRNYQAMGKLLNIDLVNYPEAALQPPVAVEIMFEGMTKAKSSFGDFTGKCLEQYFNDEITDWVNARRIINGTDCAEKIADYGERFLKALTT